MGRSRMFMTTLLPHGAVITRRGGKGYNAWGHPLEPAAQYNHESAGREKPPICPWRLEVAAPEGRARALFLHEEVAAPEGRARALFLHVFEAGRDDQRAGTPVKLIAENEQEVTVEIGQGAGAPGLIPHDRRPRRHDRHGPRREPAAG